MSKFIFGVTPTPGPMPRDWIQRRARAARKFDCLFCQYRNGDGSYRHWFEASNKGEPFNTNTADAVMAELEGKR